MGLGSELLQSISTHIQEVAIVGDMKPAVAYKDFIGDETYNRHWATESRRLSDEYNMGEGEISIKLKKTYKNRYYIYKKNAAKSAASTPLRKESMDSIS